MRCVFATLLNLAEGQYTSTDLTLRVWDLETGETIASFAGEGYVGKHRSGASAVQPIFAGDELARVYFLQLVEADETKPLPGEVKIPLLLKRLYP